MSFLRLRWKFDLPSRLSTMLCQALLLIVLPSSVAHAQEQLSLSEYRSKTEAKAAEFCAEKRARLDKIDPIKNPGMAEQTRADIEVWCNCMPAEAGPAIERLGAAADPKAATEAVWKTMAVCVGKGQRAQIVAQCPTDRDTASRVSDVSGYCGCVGANIAKLNDLDLRQQTEQAYNDAMNKAKAQKEKGPLSPIPPAIRHFGAGCQTAGK